ncbi:GntR family transcriptional regulator [Amycolatopsis pithecellobii]|uniref:FCD domain-containing protein n=1 Tax=Amycolatopsis pithecellobii TaxID=664692 RepID=A0A6N7YR28_9PSEU|nr:GntR family transcriptional regulator [Amycolatopsis pithecellobii]MTD55477.1 FCD domain-containing protein [Amycolatopsis pithecellobii]
MPRRTFVAGVERVHIPESRQAIPYLHSHLRELILDGTLVPGTKLSQVTLAEQLGVSRTPLREVLRMLQEERLVIIEPNQRTRIAEFDPEELDQIYASRIMLETLAVSMSLGGWCSSAHREGKKLLTAMRRAARTRDINAWFDAHGRFHKLLTARAGDSFRKQLQVLSDRAIRPIRIYQLSEPDTWQAAGQAEHTQILDAVMAGDERAAVTGMARHLARTAFRVLKDCAPEYTPTAVPHAVALLDRRPPQDLRLPRGA